jgi:hypothetical protein
MLNCAAGHAELPDGRLFAVYYWADGAPVSCPSVHRSQPDKGHSCYERGTFFTPEDFGRGFLVDSEWQVALAGRRSQARKRGRPGRLGIRTAQLDRRIVVRQRGCQGGRYSEDWTWLDFE